MAQEQHVETPKKGEILRIETAPETTYQLDVDLEAIDLGDNDRGDLVIAIDNDGDGFIDSYILFIGLADMAGHPTAATLEIGGVVYDAAVLIKAYELGNAQLSGGVSVYSDDFGSLEAGAVDFTDTLSGEVIFGKVLSGVPIDSSIAPSVPLTDGSSGGSGSGDSGDSLPTLAGQVVDGYIAGATVFRDANDNGILDTGEVSGTTDLNGNFSLTGGSGPIVATGGTDVSTGLAFDGVLKAPEGSTVITPLTTLVQQLVESGDSAATAEAKVKTALGISQSFKLTSTDPVKAAVDGDFEALNVVRAGVKVANTVKQIKAVFSGDDESTVEEAAYKALSGLSTIDDLRDISDVNTLLNNVKAEGSLTSIHYSAQSELIAEGNKLIDGTSGENATETLKEIAKVAKISQGDAIDVLKNDSPAEITSFATDYNAKVTAVTDAEIGDVDGSDASGKAAEFLTRWYTLDAKYVDAAPVQVIEINKAFVELGNDYVDYLGDGGAPLFNIVKIVGSPGDNGARSQSLHDNILGNLGDGTITSRFTNKGEDDPRSEAAKAFGDRPYHAGYIDGDGEYNRVADIKGAIDWDFDHGIPYPDDLPAAYKPFTNGTLQFGIALSGHTEAALDAAEGDNDGFHPGTGNSDINFVVHNNAEAKVEAAIKAKGRYVGDLEVERDTFTAKLGYSDFNANGNPVDNSDVGFWNFDYSVIDYSGDIADKAAFLSKYSISVTADFVDFAGNETENVMTFDADAHESQKNEGYYNDASGNTIGLQNSQNISWYSSDYNATTPGTYTVTLTVKDGDEVVAETQMKVEVKADIVVGAGETYTTIQAAIDAAQAGDVIFVKPGTYEEDIIIDKTVKLYGAYAGIDGSAVRPDDGESFIKGGITVKGTADNTTIDGFSIDGGHNIGGEIAGVYLAAGATDVLITNNSFEADFPKDTPTGGGPRGVLTTSGADNDGLEVSHNVFEGWASGIYLNPGATNAEVTDNLFTGNRVGISNDGPHNFVLTNNTFEDGGNGNSHVGMASLSGNGEVIIDDNTFSGANRDIGIWGDGLTLNADSGEFDVYLLGNVKNITVKGDASFNVIGNDGENTINGGAGDDTLDGGLGADVLYGGAGDDFIPGWTTDKNEGSDRLIGGDGADTFVLGIDDLIADFKAGEDILALTPLKSDLGSVVQLRQFISTESWEVTMGFNIDPNTHTSVGVISSLGGTAEANLLGQQLVDDGFFVLVTPGT